MHAMLLFYVIRTKRDKNILNLHLDGIARQPPASQRPLPAQWKGLCRLPARLESAV